MITDFNEKFIKKQDEIDALKKQIQEKQDEIDASKTKNQELEQCLSPKCAKYEAAHQTSHLCSIGSGRLSVPIQQAEQPIAHASRYT